MKLFRCKKGEKEVNNQRSNKLSKQPTGRKYSIYFWAAVSFCLIFYGTSSTSIEHFDENSLKNILNSIGQAIISGLVITFIINIPDMFSYFQKVLYKTITSDEYLEQLTLEEVEDLKNSCTKLISKSIPDIAEGLLELEYKIVEYYRSPYYENYSTFVSCSRDGNYLVKDITTEYTLKNPMAGKEKIEAIVGLDLFFCKNSNSTSPKLMEFTIQNENEEKKNILELSEMHETPINTEGAYNTKATIAHKSTVEKYKILLDKSTYVKLRYISYAPISDKSYISILRYPTKNYKMVFHNPKNDLSFSGDFIGPLLTDDHIMVNKKEGLINIDCTTWCLPGDGVTVAIFEKENANC